MLLVTQTDYLADYFGIECAIEMIADAGFDAIDYSMFPMSDDACELNGDDFRTHVRKIKEAAQRRGIPFTQAHAPFSFPMLDGEQAYIEKVRTRVIRAMEIASMLEVPIIVVHPLQFRPYWARGSAKYLAKVNEEFYRSLMPYAEQFHIKVACENMWQRNEKKHRIVSSVCADPQEFNAYIDTINDPHFVACLDLGHCGLTDRTAQDCIRAMGGERIQALHVHDNDNAEDLHTLPGYGKMQWDEILKALAEIGYGGNFTFEADRFLSPYRGDPESAFCALKLMESVGRKMIRKINTANGTEA